MLHRFSKTSSLLAYLITAFLFIDIFNKVFIAHEPERIFWYSTVGLAFMAVALFTENSFLVTAVACALFIPEGIWTIGFFSFLFFQKSFPGISSHAFSLSLVRYASFITLYHLIFIPSLIYATTQLKKVSRFGWVGAFLFASIVGMLTYTLNDGHDNINCIYSIQNCISLISPLYKISNPLRIVIAIMLLTLFIYIPTNIVLFKTIRQKHRKSKG